MSNDATTDDGAENRTEIFNYEPVAAARYDGDHECQYECEDTADWAVEWKAGGYTGGRVSLMCQSCSRDNRVYAEENRLARAPISEDGLDCLPDEIVDDLAADGGDEA